MKLKPKLLWVPLALLAAGLIVLVAGQTVGALEQVDQAQQDKARTLAGSIVSAIRGVVRYGPDKEGRVQAVLDEVSTDPAVLSVAVFDEAGAAVMAAGQRPPQLPRGPSSQSRSEPSNGALRLVEPFEITWRCPGPRPGCGEPGWPRGGRHADVMPPGRYQLLLVLDRRAALQVRDVITLEAVALSLIIALVSLFGWLLMRAIRQKERLARRVELERQRSQNLESLRLLAAGLAHEIRNPLAAIRGYTQLIHEKAPDEEARSRSGVILAELDRVTERLEEFLSFARGRRIELESIDLGALAGDVVTLLEPDARAAGIAMSARAPEGAVVQGDPQELKELLLNLTLNAIQACSEGDEVVLEVSLAREQIQLAVRDTGKGIAPDDLPRVFEPYFTTRSSGSGLGLAISKRIAEGHGATLAVHSEPGSGTAVTLTMPATS